MRQIIKLLAITLLGLFSIGQVSASILYGITGSGRTASSLYTIDTSTGASTLIGATGFNEVVSIDFNPVTGTLYGISNDTQQLITINTTTGAGTAVANMTWGKNSPDMSFNSAGTLYTWSEASPDRLNTVNLTTGATTEIGPNSLSTYQLGLDINSADVIYVKNGDGNIYSINATTGAETLVVNIGGFDYDNILAFDPTDVLYTVDRTSSTTSDLYTIDLTTGSTTLIGATGLGRLAALAFAPSSVPEPVTLALMGLGLAGIGFSKRRTKS